MTQAKLPARPNLTYLRKKAKRRAAAQRADGRIARLAEVQLSIAREYGFSSWRKLKEHIDTADTAPSTTAVTEIFDAIKRHDAEKVRKLLESNAALANVHTEESGTPLHAAAEHDDAAIVHVLLGHGADPTTRYAHSAHTPLSWALTVGSFQAADALLRGGVKPDLFCAAGLGQVKALREFFDDKGNAVSGASETGSSRYAADGSRLPRPPADPVEVASDALYIACRNGQVDVVRFLLKQKVDLSFRAFIGGTLLHWAHFNGSREVIDLLLAAGADPTARDDVMKATPRAFGIMVPCEWGILGLVRQHLKTDPSLARVSDGRGTPLHEAARGGHASIVESLFEAGAEAAAKDVDGKTPADIAREKGHTEVLRLLEAASGKDLPAAAKTKGTQKRGSSGWKPLMDAAFTGDAKRVEALLKGGADSNTLSSTAHKYRPLHRAIEHKKTMPKHKGHDRVVQLLLKHGADPKLRGTFNHVTALQLAASEEPRFVPLLIEHFKPLDIFHACAVGDQRRVAALLKQDASLAVARDVNDRQPLHYCAASAMFTLGRRESDAQVRIARLLIKAGADPMATHLWNHEWPIPVLYHCCGAHNNPSVARVLFEAGATPYDNETVYHASDEMHDECLALIEEFTKAKKLATECTRCLRTQLHWGRTRGAKWLLDHGADPNEPDTKTGNTALHQAAKHGSSESLIQLLLNYGASATVKNVEGRTPIDVAKNGKNGRVARQLKAAIHASRRRN